MYAHVRKGLVVGGLFILCLCLVNFFSESSEPTDLKLSSVWGGYVCSKCITYTNDCDSPPDDCMWDDEFRVCLGEVCAGGDNRCEMDNAGHCEMENPGYTCTLTMKYCLKMGTYTCDCVKTGDKECGPDENWVYYDCQNGSYNGCSGTG